MYFAFWEWAYGRTECGQNVIDLVKHRLKNMNFSALGGLEISDFDCAGVLKCGWSKMLTNYLEY